MVTELEPVEDAGLAPVGTVVGVVVEVGTVVVGVVEAGTVVVGVVEAVVHVGVEMVSAWRVTPPFRARSLPATDAPVPAVIDVSAMIVPSNTDAVPSVAELVTCQKTLHAWAPLVSSTLLDDPVIRVLAAWKMKTELGLSWPLSVTVPLSPMAPPV